MHAVKGIYGREHLFRRRLVDSQLRKLIGTMPMLTANGEVSVYRQRLNGKKRLGAQVVTVIPGASHPLKAGPPINENGRAYTQ